MWVIITLLVAVYLVWRFSRSENKKIETNKKVFLVVVIILVDLMILVLKQTIHFF